MIALLLTHLWSSTIFLLLVFAAIALLRNRLTANARFSLALIGIVKFAIPAAPLIHLRPQAPLSVPLQFLGGSFPAARAAAHPSVWPAMAVAAWLVIAFALIVRQTLIHQRLVSLSLRTALPPRPLEIDALSRARRRLGIRQSIDIVRSALPEAPAVLRSFRPVIVLPAGGCDDLSAEELESLLAHECAHVARRDNLFARLESIICALFWFHPLIWIAQRITVIERERACDEAVADSAEERDTYTAALTKFCHATIAPRLPGVSCMATANLKERIDHVMSYPSLKAHALSPRRVALLGAAALVLFTLFSSIATTASALASNREPYAVRISATRAGDSVELQVTVSDNKDQQSVSSPKIAVDASRHATARFGSTAGPAVDATVDVSPGNGDALFVDVTIAQGDRVVQRNRFTVVQKDAQTISVAHSAKFTGEPISLDLSDADLHDVIGTFGKLTGNTVQIDDAVQGKVSVVWHNVPWDQAFDDLMNSNGLQYRIEGKTIFVTKR